MEGAAMRRIGCVVGMGLALSVLAAGCAPPVLSVRHRFPADVPLPAGARHVRIGEFVVAEGSQEAFGTFVAEALAARLQASWAYEVVGSEDGADAVPADTIVSGTLRIEVRDTQGTRRVRAIWRRLKFRRWFARPPWRRSSSFARRKTAAR